MIRIKYSYGSYFIFLLFYLVLEKNISKLIYMKDLSIELFTLHVFQRLIFSFSSLH